MITIDKDFLRNQLELLKQKKVNPNITWQDIADFRFENRGILENVDTVRKGYILLKDYIDAGWVHEPSNKPLTVDLGAPSSTAAIQKERFKVQTEKIESNRWLRELARDEMIAENIINTILSLEPLKIPEYIPPVHHERTYLLAFGDAHYGIEFQLLDFCGNIINEYSPEIFENRMWDLFNQVVETIKKENITLLNIFELGDGLQGILRLNSQLMKLRYGIIDSSILYANFLAEWLNALSQHVRINFQMVTDSNHNQLRIVNAPKNAFPEENMSKSMLVLIKERLKNNPNISIIENPTGMNFSVLSSCTVLGIHGETKDKTMTKTIKDISQAYRIPIDYIIGAHCHHFVNEENGINSESLRIRSIIGVDPYGLSLNLTSNAGASMFIFETGKGKICELSYKLD